MIGHHIKEAIITILPTGSFLLTALETSNGFLKLIAGVLTIGWLVIRIAIAWKEYKDKTDNNAKWWKRRNR